MIFPVTLTIALVLLVVKYKRLPVVGLAGKVIVLKPSILTSWSSSVIVMFDETRLTIKLPSPAGPVGPAGPCGPATVEATPYL